MDKLFEEIIDGLEILKAIRKFEYNIIKNNLGILTIRIHYEQEIYLLEMKKI